MFFSALSVCQLKAVDVTEDAESVLLPFESKKCKREDIIVEWKRIQDKEVKAIVYEQGRTQHHKNNKSFWRHTEMKKDPRTTGNASLTLRNVSCEDGGVYICTVCDNEGKTLEQQVVVLLVHGQYKRIWLKSSCWTHSCPLVILTVIFLWRLVTSHENDVSVTKTQELMYTLTENKQSSHLNWSHVISCIYQDSVIWLTVVFLLCRGMAENHQRFVPHWHRKQWRLRHFTFSSSKVTLFTALSMSYLKLLVDCCFDYQRNYCLVSSFNHFYLHSVDRNGLLWSVHYILDWLYSLDKNNLLL